MIASMSELSFKDKVQEIVAQIPEGKVMSYGQIAALAGSPRAARQVGQIARYGNTDLPWQRVVKKDGFMASGFPGGMAVQRAMLEAEGVEFGHEFNIKNVSDIIFING